MNKISIEQSGNRSGSLRRLVRLARHDCFEAFMSIVKKVGICFWIDTTR